ncbi:MAG: zinc ribbon domain-containing protein [Saprospiraceae bacterium]|nr:zinc ribbon domain-containing protein [Saprospiraceae bacterium]
MPESPLLKCPQCGFEDSGKFCSNCGFTFAKQRLSSGFYTGNIIDFFFNFESSYTTTVKNLFTRPIGVVQDYVEGYRANYYVPTKYWLLNTGLNLLLFNLLQIDKIEEEQNGISAMEYTLLKSDLIFDSFLNSYSQFLAALLIPLFVISSFIVFPKSNYNIAERATSITYFFGQLMLIQIGINVISYFYHPFVLFRPYIIEAVEIVAILMISKYFFKQSIINTIWKSVFIMAFIYFGMLLILYLINIGIQWQHPSDELIDELR